MEYKPILQSFSRSLPRVAVKRWYNGLLVRSTNWLGDLLMTLPAVHQLRQLIPPGCGLFVLAPAPLAALWQACPWVDVVVPMAEKRITQEEISQVRRLCPGVAVVLPNSFGSAWDVWRCHTAIRIGRAGRMRSYFLTRTLPEWPRQIGRSQFHQLSYYLELVSVLGEIAFTAQCPPLQVSAQAAEKNGIHRQEGWLALAPGAAFGPAKQWPAQYFACVAQKWLARGGKVVLLGARKEMAAATEIAQRCPTVLNLTGQTSLAELMSVLANVQALVANDSGAMHLAAALGTAGVAVFGSTDPVSTGPLGATWRILAAATPCSPCFQRVCARQGAEQYACLKEISPEAVFAELMLLR